MAGLLAPPYGVMDSGATNDSEYDMPSYTHSRQTLFLKHFFLCDAGMPDKDNLNNDPLNFMSKNLNKVRLMSVLVVFVYLFNFFINCMYMIM